MKTKYLICIFVLFFLLVFFCLQLKNGYNLKIVIETQYQNPIELDENLAKNIEDEFLNMPEIKDVVLLTSKNGCKIYCKFSLFQQTKQTIDKINRTLTYILKDFEYIDSIKFDENYSKKYQCFVVISNKNNYYDLKKYSDLVLDKLLELNISSDIKALGLQQKTSNIYFSNNDLLNFDLNIEDLCEAININQTNINYFENIKINGDFKDIQDIKNLTVLFKNKSFSTKFSDIFQIKEEIKTPKKQEVFYCDKNAIVFAISPKNIFSLFFLKHKLKDFEVEVFNLNSFKKIEIYLSQNSDIELSSNKYKEIVSRLNSDKILGFVGVLPLNYKNIFDEIYENRIIIFYKNSIRKKLLNELNRKNLKYFSDNKIVFSDKYKNGDFLLSPQQKTKIVYKINEYNLSDYGLSKNNIIKSLLAQNEGLKCGSYWQNGDEIEIILKNLDDNYFYSKKYKNLVAKNVLIEFGLISENAFLARRKHKALYIKKPKTHL